MGFFRIRTIKNRRYRYYEERHRNGKRVISISKCLGAVGTGAIMGTLAVRDVMGKEKPRQWKTGKAQTDERANKHQVDYERELFINDREKWHAHMRDKLFKHQQRKEAPKQSREEVKAGEARAAEMREFSERLKASSNTDKEAKPDCADPKSTA